MDKPMTKQRLEQYRSLKREIELLESKVNVFSNDYVSDTVRSSAVFPYAPHIVSVKGYRQVDTRVMRRLRDRQERLARERDEIEAWIDGVADSQMRMILTLRYVDGQSWNDVAAKVGGGNTEKGVQMVVKRFFDKV